MPTVDDLIVLDRLTDAEVDNLRTAIRQGDLDDDAWPCTWLTVKDSVDQMPEEVLAHYGEPGKLHDALARVLATVPDSEPVEDTYRAAGLL